MPPGRGGGRPSTPPGAASNDKNSSTEQPDAPAREALGRSRGGLTCKLHLVADRRCRPIAQLLTAGHRHDSIAFESLLAAVCIHRRGAGRPRTRPDRVLADKAYSNKAIRAYLRRRGIRTTIPEPADRQAHRARRGHRAGRPPAFDPHRYRQRNVVERCINKLKEFRAVATRYDKREYVYRGTVNVASIRIWLKDPVPDPQDRPLVSFCGSSGPGSAPRGQARPGRYPRRAGAAARAAG